MLLMHLAKWEHQPMQRAQGNNSWRSSINTQRGEIPGHIEDSPSLEPYIPQAMEKAWKVARVKAADETGLPVKTFPEQCPYTFEQALDWDWLPE